MHSQTSPLRGRPVFENLLMLAGIMVAGSGLLTGCAHGRLKVGAGKEGEVVEAEGWASIDPKDILGTRRRALADAQKKAVEKVVGVYISAQIRVEQAISVDEKILANVGGYIQKYEPLNDWDEGGFHKTRIRALVLYKKVGEDLKGLGLIHPKPPPGNPKVWVSIHAKGPHADAWTGPASAALLRTLVERGFSVVDSDAKADLMVSGEAEAYPLVDTRLGDFRSYRARLSVQVVKSKTGEVVSQKSQEASAIDPAAEIAASKALDSAGQLAGEALVADMVGSLKSQVGVTLKIVGFKGLEMVERLAEELRITPGIAGAALSDYHEGTAELAVTTDGMTGEELAAELLRMQKYNFKVLSVTPYQVEIQGS